MIALFSGTPGSGKSLRLASHIYRDLRTKGGRAVIANFPIDLDFVSKIKHSKKKKKLNKFTYVNNFNLTPSFLINYAKENHKIGIENQSLLCIDEAQILFNSRNFGDKLRMNWLSFFSQHRKLGYTIILIAQNDRMLDRQIRSLIEDEYKFKKVNRYKILKLLPFALFSESKYWYCIRERTGSCFFRYNKTLGNIYNTFELFE